ncbi:MAG: toxin-antitoxin system TumE family protein [Promethearchaeota archaeon]
MKGLDKLIVARKRLLNELLTEIKDEYIDDERPFLKITFFKGLILYIRYNDYDEYSYQLVFSQKPLDRIRYDNYDDMWKVKSKPHHFHLRGDKTAIESPMNGNPKNDIPILLKKLLKKEFKNLHKTD